MVDPTLNSKVPEGEQKLWKGKSYRELSCFDGNENQSAKGVSRPAIVNSPSEDGHTQSGRHVIEGISGCV